MHVPYRRCDEIAAYSYRAEILCPACTIEALIAAGDAAPAARDMAAETVLDQCAGALAVDRDDETTFDSDEFPKVVHLDQVAADERCGVCRQNL